MESIQIKEKRKGWWIPGESHPVTGKDAAGLLTDVPDDYVYVVNDGTGQAFCQGGSCVIGDGVPKAENALPLLGVLPPIRPEDLGDPYFKRTFGLRYAYVAGAMANGITSREMVREVGKAGMLGFLGAAGMAVPEIEQNILWLKKELGSLSFGSNLIHSPNHPDIESAVVRLYLAHNVNLVSASAYVNLTPYIVYYRLKGIHRNGSGRIVCPNKIIGKVSRVEVARRFLSPPSERILRHLVNERLITNEEAELGSQHPMADALTAEADSGGHTDNRSAISLLPIMMAIRDSYREKFGYKIPIPVGLGGGIATPESAAAAFSMGAAYILTGSVNQACTEAGTSDQVREMLAQAGQADVTMAPSADMFEMGVKVQVLKRGTMFPLRASKLYDLYSRFETIEDLPPAERQILERDFFKRSLEEEWEDVMQFFYERDPVQIDRAEKSPKHKMALLFRSYLGKASSWAIRGDPARVIDYQIWCGPAMGAFNEWAKGSFLEKPENRKTVCIAMNLLHGASVITRLNWLRSQGIVLPAGLTRLPPKEFTESNHVASTNQG